MRAPLSWLRDFTPAEGTPEEIARVLSFLGLVVEGTEYVGTPLDGIVAARVLATRPHPAADRIQLVDVDAGDGQALQICCGAFNMNEGDLVPLATVGTTMPSGLEIGRRKLRGEWSNGMLCSAPELGVGPEGPTPAILVLPPGSVAPGEPVAEILGMGPDVVFDLEISPNRGDAFSIAGVARDLAAGMRLPFSLPEPAHVVAEDVAGANVGIDDAAAGLCRRFTGTVIERVGSAVVSPVVRRRLTLAGMRPISPVVDVSNYVMLELGQPNHPYDLDRLGGRGLVARRAKEGEEIVTLDEVKRSLSADDCVIADANGVAVGVAGIMGGATAEISPGTETVLLEAANFDPQATSATGQRLGLLSEARTRFERGVDIEVADRAIDRFVELLGPMVRRGETTDVRTVRLERTRIWLRTERVNLVLGTTLNPGQCADLLAPLGFESDVTGGPSFEVTVPTWRPDCGREIDLVEEVARIYGYDNIARSVPPRSASPSGLSDYQKGRRVVQEVLVGAGANEAWTSSFLSAPGHRTGWPGSHLGARAREPSRPSSRATPHLSASRAAQRGPFQHRAPGGRTKPVRARECLHARSAWPFRGPDRGGYGVGAARVGRRRGWSRCELCGARLGGPGRGAPNGGGFGRAAGPEPGWPATGRQRRNDFASSRPAGGHLGRGTPTGRSRRACSRDRCPLRLSGPGRRLHSRPGPGAGSEKAKPASPPGQPLPGRRPRRCVRRRR